MSSDRSKFTFQSLKRFRSRSSLLAFQTSLVRFAAKGLIVFISFQHMVQTGMTTPYSAFAQQNGDHSAVIKPDMKGANDGGGGGPPNGVNQVNFILPGSELLTPQSLNSSFPSLCVQIACLNY